MYGARHLGDARVLLLFRSQCGLDNHHRDAPRHRELLHGAFAGTHPHVDRRLGALDRTPAFSFDSITQLRPSAAARAWPSSARTSSPRNRRALAATTSARSPPTSAQWRTMCAAAARSR
ncbi:hypothetical protein [Streptomyces sp. XY332]|uniref:hypothetical protein n=1 Tax=Streptomyces sp. XY332 TaxID=1415561 RepID=UPI0018FEB225|nr:hypothetical protein [Streptomyces sp. XY332]